MDLVRFALLLSLSGQLAAAKQAEAQTARPKNSAPSSRAAAAAAPRLPPGSRMTPSVAAAGQFGISPRLDSLPQAPIIPFELEADGNPLLAKFAGYQARPDGRDPALQSSKAPAAMPAASSFPGQSNPAACSGCLPPDTNGDVGPNHYVQVVNLTLAVYDKSGGLHAGFPVATGNLWAAGLPGSQCASTNSGDPIVQYDHLADRWLVSQLSIGAAYHQCLAVSTSPDPAGSWYLYDFLYSATVLNDYPHFGVWPDAYYMSINQFYGGYSGTGAVVAYERARLLAGDATARQVIFDLNSADPNFGGMLPADLDGPAPPAGSPGYFLEVDPAGIISGDSSAMLRLWKFHADWTTPSNSTFGLNGLPDFKLPVADYTLLCPATRSCIPQLSTSATLDALGDRLMYRVQYRNFGDHESLVFNHTVDAGSGRAGVRWYELRSPGSSPVIQQQGTYAPADGVSRWLASAAMDQRGNIAVGFAASSVGMYPEIRYAGRLAGDAAGTLGQGEATLIAGGGAQSSGSSRWGDYSMMAVDPVDGCTFWYTQEYYTASSSSNWATRVGSFVFPGCLCTPPAAPAGLNAAPNGDNRIDLTWGAVTGATEYHVYRSLAAGGPYLQTAVVAAPATGYSDAAVSGSVPYYYVVRAVLQCESANSNEASAQTTGACTLPPVFGGVQTAGNAGQTNCAVNLGWTPAVPRCGAGINYTVYRSTSSGFTPGPGNRIASGVTGGGYTDLGSLTTATRYYYVVRAQDDLGQEEGNLAEKSAAPTGPASVGTLSETFEGGGGFDNAGWTHVILQGSVDWAWNSSRAQSGTHSWYAQSSTYSNKALLSPAVGIGSDTTLAFWHTYSTEPGYDYGFLEVSADAGASWTALPAAAFTAGGYSCSGGWCGGTLGPMTEVDASLAAYAGQTVRLRWREADDAYVVYSGWYVDSVTLANTLIPSACLTCGGPQTGAPVNPAAVASAGNQVTVSWSSGSPAASSYNVYRAQGSCAQAAGFTRLAGALGGTAFQDTSVQGGVTYAYKISGVDAAGGCESPLSACVEVVATGACTVPPVFAGLQSVVNSARTTCTLDLAWSPASALCGNVRYNVYRSTTPGFTPSPANRTAAGVTGTAFLDTANLDNGQSYHYIVRAVDGYGNEEGNTIEKSATPGGPDGIGAFTDTFEGVFSGGGFDKAGWTHGALSGATDWTWSAAASQSPAHSWYSQSVNSANKHLTSPPLAVQVNSTLTFWHTYSTESCCDYARLEVSTNGGSTWSALPAAAFTSGGYNCTSYNVWCGGTIGALTPVSANLGAYAGQTIQLRWRESDDSSSVYTGWYVDSVSISNVVTPSACVNSCAPKFTGLQSVGNSQNAICGLSLAWAPAAVNCGSGVSYDVYRSTVSGFTPAASNRIAAGLNAAAYGDYSGLLSGTRYYYVVRAVNDLGNEERNSVERSAIPTGAESAADFTENFEGALSGGGFDHAGWIHGPVSGGVDWAWSTLQAQSPSHAWLSASQPQVADRILVSPALPLLAGAQLSFWHTREFEGDAVTCYDGGTLELSTDSGANWSVVPAAAYTAGGYDGVINSGYGNPVGGKPGWCGGTIGAMSQVAAALDAYAGRTVQFRWHAGEDATNAATGWSLDSARVTRTGTAAVCGCPAPSALPPLAAADISACAVSGIQLSWSPPADWGDAGLGVRAWQVLRDGAPLSSGPCGGSLPESALGCIDTTAGAGLSHNYAMRALNGCAAAASTASAAATDADDTPSVPTGWTQASPATSPSTRGFASLVYDGARSEIMMFGGTAGSSDRNDTWTWNGVNWLQKTPALSPAARSYSAVAYDAARAEVILFGGYTYYSNYRNDTWTWNGVTWTQKPAATAPAPRIGAAMAYDPARGETVLFGGCNGSQTLNDTWVWNGSVWTLKSPALSPSIRCGSAMAYDPVRGEMVLFGGYYSYTYYAETWVWNGVTWTKKTPAQSPPSRYYPAMAFSRGLGRIAVFGGYNGSTMFADSWGWDGATWTPLSGTTAPSARYGNAMAYDETNDALIMFGGTTSSATLNDTWLYRTGLSVIGLDANACPAESVTLRTQSFSTYQWQRNGTPIPGATAQTYSVTQSGDYTVTTGSATGCSATPPARTVTINTPCPCYFAGLVSAVNGAQAGCANLLGWNPAYANCGSGVNYNVYRSTVSGFTPAPGNRIAAGVTALAYTDSAGLTNGVPYYYVVRAVDSGGGEELNRIEQPAIPGGPVTLGTQMETFEGTLSGGGFDNSGWSHGPLVGTTDWSWSAARSQTATHSWYSPDLYGTTDRVLTTPDLVLNAASTLAFWHTYSFYYCYDGGTLEISTNSGATWAVLPDAAFTAGGFTGTITGSSSQIYNKRAWCNGTLGAMSQVSVNLGAYAGQTARVRWHAGDYYGSSAGGWYVDSVTLANVGTPSSCAGGCVPPAPTLSGGEAACSVGTVSLATQPFSSYQWYSGGIPLQGATAQNFTAAQSGSYQVVVTDGGGCAAASPARSLAFANCCTPVILNNTAADVNACAASGNQVSWNTPSDWGDASGYRYLYVYRNGSTLYSGSCGYPASTATGCIDTTAVPGASYTYSVSFRNGCGYAATTPGAPATDADNRLATAWAQKYPATQPPYLRQHGMAFDRGRGVAVVFGGLNGTARNETWLWSGGNWTLAVPAQSPPARYGAALVYDESRGEVVLFGGTTGSGYLNDTWVWDGANWAQKSPATSPPVRGYASAAFDAARGETLLFGGTNGAVLGDTWVWDGGNWTQKSVSGPSARSQSAMAYDRIRQQVVLTGGYSSYSNSDTWVWNGSAWASRYSSYGIDYRIGHAMVFDEYLGKVLLFGCTACANPNQTLAWDGTNWALLFESQPPSGRSDAAMVFDSRRLQTVLYGGVSGGSTLNDTWLLAPPLVSPFSLAKAAAGVNAVFTWPDLAGAALYTVYQDPAGSGAFATPTGTAASGNPGLSVPMPAGNSLFFRVAAANSCGEGPK
jgi:hypothetical protein